MKGFKDFKVRENEIFLDSDDALLQVRDDVEVITLNNLSLMIQYSKTNVHIKNSYAIKDDNLKKKFLDLIIMKGKLLGFEYKRTFNSWLHEWKAHNTLYNWGYKRERTADVDLNEDESFLKRFIYSILAIFENTKLK